MLLKQRDYSNRLLINFRKLDEVILKCPYPKNDKMDWSILNKKNIYYFLITGTGKFNWTHKTGQVSFLPKMCLVAFKKVIFHK